MVSDRLCGCEHARPRRGVAAERCAPDVPAASPGRRRRRRGRLLPRRADRPGADVPALDDVGAVAAQRHPHRGAAAGPAASLVGVPGRGAAGPLPARNRGGLLPRHGGAPVRHQLQRGADRGHRRAHVQRCPDPARLGAPGARVHRCRRPRRADPLVVRRRRGRQRAARRTLLERLPRPDVRQRPDRAGCRAGDPRRRPRHARASTGRSRCA